jgi:hypothetical protein
MILGIDTPRGWAIGKPGERIIAAGTVKDVPDMIVKITELAGEHRIDSVLIEKAPRRNQYARFAHLPPNVQKNIAVKVGECRAKADALYYYCKGLGLNAEFVAPIRGGTKMSARRIESLTGWTGRTSEHARDAIVIAWCAPKGR